MKTCYVCTGSCGGSVSEDEFKEGKNVCGAPDCEKHGQPLVKRMVCEKCGDEVKEGEEHVCKEKEEQGCGGCCGCN